MSRWLIDRRPVRESPAFRRLWVGSTLSLIGSALTTFALPLQVYDLTRSTLAVGLLGVAELIPTLVVGLAGGALADRTDRRALASLTSVGLALISGVLAFQASAHFDLLWLLYVLAAMHAALAAISGPLRRTFIPSLLPAEQLVAGMALNRLSFQLMLTLGPALAGLIAAAPWLGLPGCYLIDAVSFAASLYGLARLPDVLYPQVIRRTLRAVAVGLRFIRRSDSLAAPLLADLIATMFGLPVALFPAINAQRFGGDPRTLGLFATAIGVGGLLTATSQVSCTALRARAPPCSSRSPSGEPRSPASPSPPDSVSRSRCSRSPAPPTASALYCEERSSKPTHRMSCADESLPSNTSPASAVDSSETSKRAPSVPSPPRPPAP